MSLSFILLIIYRNKDNAKILKLNNNKKLKYELEYTNQYEDIIYDKFKFILIASVIDFIVTILLYEFCMDIGLNMWIFDILFIYLFSFIIFKLKVYKHQYISIIIIIFVGIILDIIADNYNLSSDEIFPIIIKYICEIVFSLGIVINKYTMEKKFCPSYELCFYQGIITFILYFIFALFTTYFTFINNFEKYYKDFKNCKLKESLMFLLVMILHFITNLCIFATIEKTTSFHFMIILVIGQLAPYFKKLIDSKSNKIITIITIVGLCFILFMVLIFIEIIELNFFGLQNNTKKYIIKRAELENFTKINDNGKFDEDNDNNEDGDTDIDFIESLNSEENTENGNNLNL